MDNAVMIVLGMLAVGILLRMLAGSPDRERVGRYIQSQGGILLSMEWSPFGRGWFGEKSDRIYEVRYSDADGAVRGATCKTSMWTGVYLTDDHLIAPAAEPGEDVDRIRAENTRLRAEVDRLRAAAKTPGAERGNEDTSR